MSIPSTNLMWISALLPIIVLLVLMIKLNWSASKAAAIGIAITAFTGIVIFKADLKLLLLESGKGIWSAVIIILVIWTAILLYQTSVESGAFLVIREGMYRLFPNEMLRILAMGWIFESFLQGITGFGVPVAIGTPLLIGIGVKPLWAIIISLLGQSWGNTFGTLAAAWDALAVSTGLKVGSPVYLRTAIWVSVFILIWNAVIGFVICWFYGKKKAIKKMFPVIISMVIIQGGGELVMSQINTTLACFVPSCISFFIILLFSKTKLYRDEWTMEDSKIMEKNAEDSLRKESIVNMTLMQAFVPYFILAGITLIILIVKPIHDFLGQFSFGIAFPETRTGYGYINSAMESFSPFTPFTHASMFLFISSVSGIVYYCRHGWIKRKNVKDIFARSTAMMIPSGLAILGLIIMSRIMSGTGQTLVLANGIAGTMKRGYGILAPLIGLFGTFMTGSNMSSNILFGNFQLVTAQLLKIDVAIILGAQSAGGSIGSVLSPSNIVLGTTTAGISGYEGKIIRKLLGITIPVAIIIGIVLLVVVYL